MFYGLGLGLRVIVCVKHAVNVAELRVDAETGKVEVAAAPKKMSDIDKNAVEEAVRIKEKTKCEVIAVSLGGEDAKLTLREALAMGADSAYLISDESLKDLDTLTHSYVLAKAIEKIGNYDLILCGEASIDGFTGLMGPRIAEWLGLPHIAYVKKLEVSENEIIAERDLEDCVEVVKAKVPALITVTRGINEPRIPSIMGIMAASKKPLTIWKLEDLELKADDVASISAVSVLEVKAPKIVRKGIIIEGETPEEIAEKLVEALIKEGIIS